MSEYYSKEDRQLIKRCIAQDRHAQRLLYGRYAQAMYHTVIRMIPDQMDAEDVLQEAFLNVFRKLDTFHGDSSIGAWIKRIVVNSALNFIRKNKISYLSLEDNWVEEAEEEQDYSQVSTAQIHEAIKALPDGCRTVFSLYQLEGYRHKEIAEILDITESTSKTQYRRAKNMLQQQLKKKLAKCEVKKVIS
jgi:RNA polymerase sigma-70 factor (ECF subfamily)